MYGKHAIFCVHLLLRYVFDFEYARLRNIGNTDQIVAYLNKNFDHRGLLKQIRQGGAVEAKCNYGIFPSLICIFTPVLPTYLYPTYLYPSPPHAMVRATMRWAWCDPPMIGGLRNQNLYNHKCAACCMRPPPPPVPLHAPTPTPPTRNPETHACADACGRHGTRPMWLTLNPGPPNPGPLEPADAGGRHGGRG